MQFLAQVFAAALVASQLAGQAQPTQPDPGRPATPPEGAPPGIEAIDRADLRAHANWLADDARAGRHTASRGQEEAAQYIAAHFKKLGLRPLGDQRGYLQRYAIERLVLDKSTGLTFGKHRIKDGFAVLHASDSDKVRLRGKFVWLGNGADIRGSIKGRIPVIAIDKGAVRSGVGGDLQAVQRYQQIAQRLAKRAAKAAVICLLDDQGSLANTLNYKALLRDHGVMSLGGTARPPVKVPLLVLNAAHSRALLDFLGVDGDGKPTDARASGKLSIQVQRQRNATACNVVAVLEGRGKKAQAVVISAHHDHVGTRIDGDCFNGADDNASGTAGLLELAQAFATAEARPARSIVFLSVSGEELGLWGSQHFASHPTWPKDRIIANINIDMIGRAGRKGDAIQMQITPSHAHAKYSTLVQKAVELGAKFGIAFRSGDTYYRRSDHYNFARLGIPVVFFCDGEHPDYHQVTDHADRLDYAAMESITRLAYWTAWQTADASSVPKELGKQRGWQ